jgi:hypothetical protein
MIPYTLCTEATQPPLPYVQHLPNGATQAFGQVANGQLGDWNNLVVDTNGNLLKRSDCNVTEVANLQQNSFKSLYRRLTSLSKLPTNWNSYGASPPNDTALATAWRFLNVFQETAYRPTSIGPSAEDGVCISFVMEGRRADVEVFNDGDVLTSCRYAGEESDIRE